MLVEASGVIDRPIDTVFRFCAADHVANHPRWDPQIKLEQVSSGPIGVGTTIRRWNSHGGTETEGTMEIDEYEPNRAFGGVIREGGSEYRGAMTFEPRGEDRTVLTIGADIPSLDESAADALRTMMKRSVANMKDLIESET